MLHKGFGLLSLSLRHSTVVEESNLEKKRQIQLYFKNIKKQLVNIYAV